MIKTKKWRDAKDESDVKMHVEDWMADEIDGLRDELTEVYKQCAELLEALVEVVALQEKLYGYGMDTHVALSNWAKKHAGLVK